MAKKTPRRVKRIRQCLVCRCTDGWGCPGGCEWGKGDDRDLCSVCIEARDALALYLGLVHASTKRSILLLYGLAQVEAGMA